MGNKFSDLGVSPKWVKSKRRRRRKKEERLKVGNNNGQLRIPNATSGGARKPPEPIPSRQEKRSKGVKWKNSWSNLILTKSVSAQEKYFQYQVQQDMSHCHFPAQ